MPGNARRINIGHEQGSKDDGHHVTQVAEEGSSDLAGQTCQVPCNGGALMRMPSDKNRARVKKTL